MEWIIAGGGIHGCTIATYLIKAKGIPASQICIIDPHKGPIEKWKDLTARIAMPFLRSPSVHHCDIHPFSLHYFNDGGSDVFYGKYKRPGLDFFNHHSEAIFTSIGLQERWQQGRVQGVTKSGNHWVVETDSGSVEGKNLVIATGMNERLSVPEWAEELRENRPAQVGHIFQENLPVITPDIAVVGGGITAAHLVIKLSREHPGRVVQISRHPYRVHDFDSDPGWLGPKFLRGFHSLSSYKKRRQAIHDARHRGSVTSELRHRLRKLEERGAYRFIQDEVEGSRVEGSTLSLYLKHSRWEGKTLLLATGYCPKIMKTEWVRELVRKEGLVCAQCGFPIVNEHLEWCDHLYVSGPLAELEIGPVARNIAGARKAAERIIGSM